VKPSARVITLAVAVTAILTAGGATWGQRQDEVHEATAVILVNPLVGSPFSPDNTRDDLVNLATEAELVTSDAVARLVGQELAPAASLDDLLSGVSVEVPPNTQLLRISARSTTSELAVERAQAFAGTYLTYRERRAKSELADRSAQVDEQIRERSARLAKAAAELDLSTPGGTRATLLQQELIEITSQIGQLRTQRAALQAEPSNPGQLVTPASPVPGPPLGWTVLGGLSGLLVGLGSAAVLATARARRDPSLRHDDDLRRLLVPQGIPFLGRSDAPDDIRAILLADHPRRPLVLLLATVGAPVNLTPVAAALARSMVRSEHQTLLVDLGGSATESGTKQPPGLTDVLHELTTAHDLLDEADGVPGRLGPGSTPGQLDDLVAAPRMSDVMEDLRKRADVLLLVSGPFGERLSRTLMGYADAAVLGCGDVTAEQLLGAISDMGRGVTPVAGVVRVVPERLSHRRDAP
jgi:hypothetical protein